MDEARKIIVHKELKKYVKTIPAGLQALTGSFWTGPSAA